ncbi:addiction module toxin RelE [Mucilaginibacter sp. PPCGB 2223]|uniref:type II toxin-antitoxin system HigB family toxin n=1 Tax=Mucilaginibacter sp. PPCGB 2223 TaxID=1886027 RepID=UPI00082676BD|nr:type II toxin-antitoxin system HigB family toxin [Mucilaginibacter sp. PPCGB 2223]OCX50584.1 addiction module toxin RelE [Mucilaginibacter sp. PPCGB 2223]
MVIISKSIIKDFIEVHHEAETQLENWYDVTKVAEWRNFSDVKNSFNSVDAVGNDRYVFNIKGNKYRLIALIIFKVRTVFILFIGTHSDYDKIDASNVKFKK